ncbi:MAG: peptidoglycan DD-metalloendopeptidase family protein [Lautropia sp.]|nr:peptidoglycan DD-metalloendopeptidase family protein [Lautropia sp.]
MMSDVLKRPTHVLLLMTAGILLAGCAATKPAPVVHRTSPGAQPPVATAPVELPAGEPTDQMAEGQMPQDDGPQVSPIYQGAIHQQGSNAAPDDPNLKIGPQGIKRPYGAPKPGSMASASQAGGMVPRAGAPAGAAGASVSAGSVPGTATAPASKPPAVPTETRSLDGVRFSWPVPGKLLRGFDGDANKGLLLAGTLGDPVLAAADGRVIYSGEGPRGYGNLIILKHSNEMLSVYAHNRSLSVKEGDKVKRGQKIAELGSTGTSRPALHFEVRRGGKAIDPAGVLPKR